MSVPILIAFLISTFAVPPCCCTTAFNPLTVVVQSQGKAEQQLCCSTGSNTGGKSDTAFSIAHQNCHCHAAYHSIAEAPTRSLVGVLHTDEALVHIFTRESNYSAEIELLQPLSNSRTSRVGTSRSFLVLHSQFLI